MTSIVIREAGRGVAELWSGPALLGLLHEEDGVVVLRLESRAGGPLPISAAALEHALAEARDVIVEATRR